MTATVTLFEHPNFEGRSQLASTRRGRRRYRHLSHLDLHKTGLHDRVSSFRFRTRGEARGQVLVFAEAATGHLHKEYPVHNRFKVYTAGQAEALSVPQVPRDINDRTSDVLLIRRSRTESAIFVDNDRIKKELILPTVRSLEARARRINGRFRGIRVGGVAARLVARPQVAPHSVLLGINMDFDVAIDRPVRRAIDGDLELLFSFAARPNTGVSFRFRGYRFDADGRRRVRKKVEGAIAQIMRDKSVISTLETSMTSEVNGLISNVKLESAYVLPGNANHYRSGNSPYSGDQATSGVSLVLVCGDR